MLTFATPRRSRSLTLGGAAVRYHQLKSALFFGYGISEGLYVAEPEKALLDQCYLAARDLADLAWDELDLSAINRDRLADYAARFPPAVQERARRLVASS